MAQVLEHEKESAWLNSKGHICDWLGGVAHQHGRWLQDLWSCCCHQAVDAWLLIVEPVAMLVEVPVMTGLISGNIFLLVMNLHDKIINYIYLYIFTQGLICIYILMHIHIYSTRKPGLWKILCLRNSIAARTDKLVGAKNMSVSNLFALPQPVRDCILDSVSLHGWEGAWARHHWGGLSCGFNVFVPLQWHIVFAF